MFGRLLLGIVIIAALAGPAFAEIGRIKRATGAAFVERAGKRIDAAPGLALEAGDMLVTGRDGRISITFVDNSRFSAGPGSRIAMSKFSFDPTTRKGEFVTRVDRGSLAVVSGQIAHENPDAMKVRTPTSLLGVRGTRFVVTVK
jgi:hypothetical protein